LKPQLNQKLKKKEEILTATKNELADDFEAERKRLSDIANQLSALRERLNKVQLKDQQVRLNNLKEQNKDVDEERFEKIHESMFKIMEKYEIAKEILKAISMKEDVVNGLLTSDVQRPLNEKTNIKPVSNSQQTKKDKKIVKSKDVEEAKEVTKKNEAPVSEAPKSKEKVKAVIEKLENVVDDVDVLKTEQTLKPNTDKDNSFDGNKTDNKGPSTGTTTKAKATEVKKEKTATDSDVLKKGDEPELLKDIKKDILETTKDKVQNLKKEIDAEVKSSPAQKALKETLSKAEVSLAQAGIEIDNATATELFGRQYTNYAIKKKSHEMLADAMQAVKLVEADLATKKYVKPTFYKRK